MTLLSILQDVVHQNNLPEMKRWLYRDDILTIDFGVYEKDYYHVHTREGQQIISVIEDVIKATLSIDK